MPATLVGNTNLVFGCESSPANGLLQTSNARRTGKYSEAVNYEDDIVGLAFHHGNMIEADGTFLWEGSDPYAVGDSLSIAYGTVYVYEVGLKRTKDGYAEGDFRAAGIAS